MEGLRLVESHRKAIDSLCRKYGVKRLRLFGSALREDWVADKSDFDFLAEFGSPPAGVNLFEQQFGLLADLEKLLGRPVDVVDWNAAKKPQFKRNVESRSLELYAA